MFKLFKKRTNHQDFSFLEIDFHAHLLPGIDDGPSSMQESLEIIEGLRTLGFRHLVATPHIRQGMFDNNAVLILEKLEAVRAALRDAGSEVKLEAAAEYFLDDHFMELLSQNDLMTFAGKHVLIELSPHVRPFNVANTFFEIQSRGYIPILAHPERYLYFQSDFETLQTLHNGGCMFQVNLFSYLGLYGRDIKKQLFRLLKLNLVDFLCTDIHKRGQIAYLDRALAKVEHYEFRNRTLIA